MASMNLKWLKNLKWLQHLDMTGIDLSGSSDWFQVINSLSSMLELHLSSCELTQIPSNPTSVSFTSVVVLDLSFNTVDSLLPRWIFSLHNLVLLHLSGCSFHGLYPDTYGGFHNMTSLKILHLSGNDFVNSSSIVNSLSSLRNLVSLDVSLCSLSHPVLASLRNLTSLVHLDLANNQIVETLPKYLGNLCNSTYLDLQSNNFTGSVSEILERICECESPKLEFLALRGNYVLGRLPEKLGRLKNLANVDLGYNFLTGTIPDSIGSLSLLKTFQININQFAGSIPDSIGGLSSLEFLELSYNQFNGSLPESIGRLKKLSFLSLHHNMLTGIVTEHHFVNLTSLKTLWAGDNKLVFKPSVNDWIPPFRLDVLRISSWSLGPRFPSWVQSQTNLTELDLADTNVSDTIPDWIWSTFSGITFLNLSRNNVLGTLGDVGFLAPKAVLDLSSNGLSGRIPGNFNRPDLDFIDLSNNYLSGSLDQFFCAKIQEPWALRVLNLANNNLSGVIPDCWMNWGSLVVLNLEKNKLSGEIPRSLGNISSLESLDMRNNKLSGKLPVSLLNSKSLLIVELAENELTGSIPTSVGRGETSLKLLSLRSNKLEGEIPDEICRLGSIQILDVAHNDLSGRLPTCFGNFGVISGKQSPSPIILYDVLFQNQVFGSASLVTKGRVNPYSSILYLVTTLDLSDNNFSGSIPSELMALPGLRYLNLSQNDLSGRIPEAIKEMRQLESLDLSVNHLKGKIPSSLSGLSSINFLNVSYNNLVGRIPTSTQLQSFNESSYIGNALCGAPLATCRQAGDDQKSTNDEHDESNDTDWILVICTLVGLVVGFWIAVGPLLVSKRWRDKTDKTMVKLYDCILLTYHRYKTCEAFRKARGSTDPVQSLDLSEYIFDDHERFEGRGALHEASTSKGPVRQSGSLEHIL